MTTTYIILTATGAIALGAFIGLILAPALGAYGRTWEKMAAALLTLMVLAILVSIGIAIGVLIFLNWDRLVGIF